MVFEQDIEKLKRAFTDKYVVVDATRPELARFKDATGLIKTVNMNGRALVEFDQFDNIGWYDIEIDFLKVVPKPDPQGCRKTSGRKTGPGREAGGETSCAKPVQRRERNRARPISWRRLARKREPREAVAPAKAAPSGAEAYSSSRSGRGEEIIDGRHSCGRARQGRRSRCRACGSPPRRKRPPSLNRSPKWKPPNRWPKPPRSSNLPPSRRKQRQQARNRRRSPKKSHIAVEWMRRANVG